jgi:hypothetical protein
MDSWLPRALRHTNDLFSRPATLLYRGDIGYWGNLEQLGDSTLSFVGNFHNPPESNNTGVFKNFVYGYAAGGRPWPMLVPKAWVARSTRRIGSLELVLVDLSERNAEENPALGLYVVLGRFARRAGQPNTTGFFEVLSESAFPSADDAWASVLESNAGARFPEGGPHDYTLCLSGDRLRLNPGFGRETNAFLMLNGDAASVGREHVDLSDQHALRAFTLLEAREEDDRYRVTGVTYALARGDGRLAIDNPHLERRLILDSSDPLRPRRREEPHHH